MSDDFEANLPLPQKPQRRPGLREHRESERLSPGSFMAEGRSVINERRDQLARVNMDPTHVEALRMPDLTDQPIPMMGTPAMKPIQAKGPALWADTEASSALAEDKPRRNAAVTSEADR